MLPYREERERDPLSIERRECLSSIYRGERLLLCREERVSLLDIERSETPRLLLYREEAYPLLYRQDRVSLLYIERRETPSLYKGESVFPLYM